MRYLQPVLVADLFPGERAALLEMLINLTAEQWASPTVCAGDAGPGDCLALVHARPVPRGRRRAGAAGG